MNNMENWNIKGHEVEFIGDSHTYLVDGVIVTPFARKVNLTFAIDKC